MSSNFCKRHQNATKDTRSVTPGMRIAPCLQPSKDTKGNKGHTVDGQEFPSKIIGATCHRAPARPPKRKKWNHLLSGTKPPLVSMQCTLLSLKVLRTVLVLMDLYFYHKTLLESIDLYQCVQYLVLHLIPTPQDTEQGPQSFKSSVDCFQERWQSNQSIKSKAIAKR